MLVELNSVVEQIHLSDLRPVISPCSLFTSSLHSEQPLTVLATQTALKCLARSGTVETTGGKEEKKSDPSTTKSVYVSLLRLFDSHTV